MYQLFEIFNNNFLDGGFNFSILRIQFFQVMNNLYGKFIFEEDIRVEIKDIQNRFYERKWFQNCIKFVKNLILMVYY